MPHAVAPPAEPLALFVFGSPQDAQIEVLLQSFEVFNGHGQSLDQKQNRVTARSQPQLAGETSTSPEEQARRALLQSCAVGGVPVRRVFFPAAAKMQHRLKPCGIQRRSVGHRAARHGEAGPRLPRLTGPAAGWATTSLSVLGVRVRRLIHPVRQGS